MFPSHFHKSIKLEKDRGGEGPDFSETSEDLPELAPDSDDEHPSLRTSFSSLRTTQVADAATSWDSDTESIADSDAEIVGTIHTSQEPRGLSKSEESER